MRFRPCIDIHNGTVKQIVGGSLKDEGDQARTNFASDLDAAWYARQYRKDGLKGGHIILLNPETSPYYKETKRQALEALRAYPGGMQIGGGITPYNAEEYLKAGATHVIVTSYVFRDGKMDQERLKELVHAVGTEAFGAGSELSEKGRRLLCGDGSLAEVYRGLCECGDSGRTFRAM